MRSKCRLGCKAQQTEMRKAVHFEIISVGPFGLMDLQVSGYFNLSLKILPLKKEVPPKAGNHSPSILKNLKLPQANLITSTPAMLAL